MHSTNQPTSHLDSISLLRDSLLPNLLNEDEKDILYWAGKELARSYTFDSLDDLTYQLTRVFLGTIEQTKATRHSIQFDWSGELIDHRISQHTSPSFSLEAGFLAAGYQQVSGIYSEATYDVDQKKSTVTFLLQSDSRAATTP